MMTNFSAQPSTTLTGGMHKPTSLRPSATSAAWLGTSATVDSISLIILFTFPPPQASLLMMEWLTLAQSNVL
ncbi:hypothetical protein Scep_024207 [Stephania cephalantha]|uniref:Uncharacterized protein n=1 Tax=Stephania cephalantha TaxID=152367 RepID=A0AAP0EYZ3_9MAGN